jgi:hypothetical protein
MRGARVGSDARLTGVVHCDPIGIADGALTLFVQGLARNTDTALAASDRYGITAAVARQRHHRPLRLVEVTTLQVQRDDVCGPLGGSPVIAGQLFRGVLPAERTPGTSAARIWGRVATRRPSNPNLGLGVHGAILPRRLCRPTCRAHRARGGWNYSRGGPSACSSRLFSRMPPRMTPRARSGRQRVLVRRLFIPD